MSLLLVIVTYLFSICSSVIPLDNWKSGGQASKHAYAPPAGDSATACGYLSVANYLTTHTSSFPFGYVTAVGTVPQGSQHENLFNNGQGCGACYEIECLESFIGNQDCICNSGTVTVQAIDLSGDNPEPHFDMAFDAFDVVAGSLCGRISINYRQVACEFTNNIYITTDHNDAWSYYLNFYNVAGNGKLCGVELKSYGSSTWMQCTNIASKWKCDDSSLEPTQLPLSFRLTDCAGNKITATDVVDQWGSVQADLGVNFPLTGGVTSTPTTQTPAPTFLPSKTPTTPTTLSPTNPTTPQPTSAQSNGNILLHTFGNSLGKWWYVAYLTDIANGYNVDKFEVQSYGDNTWLECTAVTVTVTEYQCQPSTAFILPLSVRLTETNGEIIISTDLITEYTGDVIYNFGDNFGKNAVTPSPTNNPSKSPTRSITTKPTISPTFNPAKTPTNIPTNLPSNNPSSSPLKNPTKTPTNNPTNLPSHNPTARPTENPIIPGSPTKAPSDPTVKPSSNPSQTPTNIPTNIPTQSPTNNPLSTASIAPTETQSIPPTETRTASPTSSQTTSPTRSQTGAPTTLNPTSTPTFKCDDTCDSDRDDDKITIKVIFTFQPWIMYDLLHIKCWLYEIFIKWFIHFEFVQYFDVCNIEIIVIGGTSNLGKMCINGPCLWDSKTRRLLEDESMGNVSVSIISDDENILQSINGLSMTSLSDILSTEITTRFDMNMDTKVDVVQDSEDNGKKDKETETFGSVTQIIVVMILVGLMMFIIGLCIIFYRKYKKRKEHTKKKRKEHTKKNTDSSDMIGETKNGSDKVQQTNIVTAETDNDNGQEYMYHV